MIDIGVNLTNRAFADDLDEVLGRAVAAGVEALVVTGTSLAESQAAIELCRRFRERLACTAGIHPHDAARAADDWRSRLEVLAANPYVKAIGETGLDFNRNYSPREAQLALFRAQIDIAVHARKPLFVHDRDTDGATAATLAERRDDIEDAGIGVVVHCFTGHAHDLQTYLDAGYHIGITGWVCDERRGGELKRLVPSIPDERLMLETDSPYLTPRTIPASARARRNEPANLVWVAREVAALRGQSLEYVQSVTAANARRFFALAPPVNEPNRAASARRRH